MAGVRGVLAARDGWARRRPLRAGRETMADRTMTTKSGLAAAVIAILAATGAALAQQGPGNYARLQGKFGGPIQLDVSYPDADGCQAILEVGRGLPPGETVSQEVLPTTIVIGPDPGGCSGERTLRRVFTISGSPSHNLVGIFFVSEQGEVLDRRTVSIQSY